MWRCPIFLLVMVSAAGPSARAVPTSVEDCPAPAVGHVPFGVGEKIDYDMDSLGAYVGSFSLTVEPARPPNRYSIHAHGKTESVVANFFAVEATGEAYLRKDLTTARYVEDATNGGIRRSLDVSFPPGPNHQLLVHATRQGAPANYTTPAMEETRDVLSALYTVRAMSLTRGEKFCMPIFGARKVWILRAKVVGPDAIRTPGGDFHTIHLVGTAQRFDGRFPPRYVELWLSDDAMRIPVAAMGVFGHRVVRAQMTHFRTGRRRHARSR